MAIDDEELLQDEPMGASGDAAGVYEPEPDEEQTREDNAERAAIATAMPLMEELMSWFDEQIAASDSIKQLVVTQKLTGIGLEESIHAHDIVRTLLEEKRDSLQARYDSFNDPEDE